MGAVLASAIFVCMSLRSYGDGGGTPQYVTVKLPGAPTTQYGKVIEASTTPTTMSAVVSCTATPPTYGEGEDALPVYSCTVGLQYKATTQQAWGAVPSTQDAANPIPGATDQPALDGNFTVATTMPDPGYYMVSVSGSVSYVDGDGNPIGPTYSTTQPTNAYYTAAKLDVVWNGDGTKDVNSGQSVKGVTFHLMDGMLCSLTAVVSPSDANISGQSWSVPTDQFVSGFTTDTPNWWYKTTLMPVTGARPGTPYGHVQPFNGSLSTATFSGYYCAPGGEAGAPFSPSFAATVNGLGISGRCTVGGEAPSIALDPTIQQPTLDTDSAKVRFAGLPFVHVGNGKTANTGPGLFDQTTFDDSPDNLGAGTLDWAQTGTSYILYHYPATLLYSDWDESNEDWDDFIDTTYPYQYTTLFGLLGLQDSPGNLCEKPSDTTVFGTGESNNRGSRDDQFTDTGLYNAGTAHCIWVPVWQVQWGWSASWFWDDGDESWILGAVGSAKVTGSENSSTWQSWTDNVAPFRWQWLAP
jgi:hypothetical protein